VGQTKVRKQSADGTLAMLQDMMQSLSELQQKCYFMYQMVMNEENAEYSDAEKTTVAKSRQIQRDIAPSVAGVGLLARATPRRLTDEEFVRQISARQEQ
jgi:hypothetical protein